MDELQGCSQGCTSKADAVDVLSDQPVPYLLTQILSSSREWRTPGVLLSLRDPHEWAAARLAAQGPDSSGGATCGYSTKLADQEASALHQLTYNAFAACLATSPRFGWDPGHLFAFNLFDGQADSAKWARNLAQWLRDRGDPRFAGLQDERVAGAAETCAQQDWPK